MKTFTFAIIEYYFGGENRRDLQVLARTEKSAYKKITAIQGNRCWDIELKKIEGSK
jgi:hypothetical protein